MPEEIIEEQLKTGFLEKLKIHKFKILGGVLGVLVFTGTIFGVYKIVQKQAQPAPQPTPVVTPTPTPDPTADWKTYTNSEISFSFKYPQTLIPSECKDGLHFFEAISELRASEFCETPPIGKISIEFSTTSLSPGYGQSSDFKISEEQITVGSTEAKKQTPEKIREAPGPDYAIFITFSKDSYYFLISLRDEQYESSFNLMLSTFKFLEEESCVGMSLSEAKEIALESECVEEGSLTEEYFCNENTGTWWLNLEIEKPGCAPACVINVSTEEAEINWRCTGLIPENEKSFVCPENNKIDCMPMIDEERGWFCEREYLDWARENCPGITITH